MENNLKNDLESFAKDISLFSNFVSKNLTQPVSQKEKIDLGVKIIEFESKKFAIKKFFQYIQEPSDNLVDTYNNLIKEEKELLEFKNQINAN